MVKLVGAEHRATRSTPLREGGGDTGTSARWHRLGRRDQLSGVVFCGVSKSRRRGASAATGFTRQARRLHGDRCSGNHRLIRGAASRSDLFGREHRLARRQAAAGDLRLQRERRSRAIEQEQGAARGCEDVARVWSRSALFVRRRADVASCVKPVCRQSAAVGSCFITVGGAAAIEGAARTQRRRVDLTASWRSPERIVLRGRRRGARRANYRRSAPAPAANRSARSFFPRGSAAIRSLPIVSKSPYGPTSWRPPGRGEHGDARRDRRRSTAMSQRRMISYSGSRCADRYGRPAGGCRELRGEAQVLAAELSTRSPRRRGSMSIC
jgi:hypothetical protein